MAARKTGGLFTGKREGTQGLIMVRSKHAKQKSAQRILAVILTLLVLVLAVLVFLYRDRLTPAALSGDSADLADIVLNDKPFTYETGSRQMFALMGENLAIASATGLQLLDRDGATVSREIFSMANPAVCASTSTCAFYDVGGYALRAYRDGEFVNLDRESEIISVSVNSAGYYAVAGYEPGYKGRVIVYNPKLEPMYEWYSGKGYILDAAVSPDSSMLAVLCAESTGSVVRIFRFDSEDEYASAVIPNELAFRLSYNSGGNLCVLSEQAAHFFSAGGEALSDYPFDSGYLADFALSEGVWVIVLSKYVSGSDVSLVSFSGSGKQAGEAALPTEPLSLFAQGDKLLVLGVSDAALYSAELRLLKQNHVVPGFSSAVLLPKGSVLLLSSHYGESCEFR